MTSRLDYIIFITERFEAIYALLAALFNGRNRKTCFFCVCFSSFCLLVFVCYTENAGQGCREA